MLMNSRRRNLHVVLEKRINSFEREGEREIFCLGSGIKKDECT